ncbi:MAG: trypsin-like peptidase domain-containing protein [Acidobacteria bacterium]|nr:trypsin-like peptidase domain-containing protein [Acidobacteriota bacterium]
MKHGNHRMLAVVFGMAAAFWAAAGAALPAEGGSPPIALQEQSAGVEAPASGKIENSVVKVFATLSPPDLSKPWSKQTGNEVTASGVVIEGRRILTNAHVVQYARQIQIQGYQSGDKISAAVESIAYGIDLAVLKLGDESFFDSHLPLPRSEALPRIKDSVMVYGFPTGGNSMSITKGIVSRIDFAQYASLYGLRVQIDAAINPGNSGGPAVVGDKMIGVVFSILQNTQNIGYIIPWEEINLFLDDVQDGRYDGKPGIFDSFQTLENQALRAFLKLDKSIEGIVVHQPFNTDSEYPLRKWDVITKIGDAPVDNQGNILFGENLKIMFISLVQKIARNGKVPLTIVRGGREMSIQMPVEPIQPKLIPFLQGTYPSYFICGPLVFSVAVEDLIAAMARGPNGIMTMQMLSLNGNPLFSRRSERPAFEGEELVMVPSPFFTHSLARNYSSPVMRVVNTVNGIAVKNLLHLVEIIRDSKDEFLVIDFAGRGMETLVFPRQEMIAATEEILNDNGIRSLGSPDVMEIWEAKAR